MLPGVSSGELGLSSVIVCETEIENVKEAGLRKNDPLWSLEEIGSWYAGYQAHGVGRGETSAKPEKSNARHIRVTSAGPETRIDRSKL